MSDKNIFKNPKFARIPEEDWTQAPVDSFALQYDSVKEHGWYKNLDPTIEDLTHHLKNGETFLDYSGGTGIFVERLFKQFPTRQIGTVIVDSSPKFLRLALEKFRQDKRVGFRLIRFLKEKKRLQYVDEVLDLRFHALVSTNAIHLYYDLQETLQSWARILYPGSKVFIQSGNIRGSDRKSEEWIIDETIEAVHLEALKIVKQEKQFSVYRNILKDEKKMLEYQNLRQKYFLPTRPVEYYLEELKKAGFTNLTVSWKKIEVRVKEWFEFLSAYHEGVLGWVGGSEKVEGVPPDPSAIQDRLLIIQKALGKIFSEQPIFFCGWCYLTGTTEGQYPKRKAKTP
ncbi:MAG: class I SAM-dependent methyltransferase [Firmicutes bacterium]|nr:class I SAM-dependent methyltransferase [Bacillota bacterium]